MHTVSPQLKRRLKIASRACEYLCLAALVAIIGITFAEFIETKAQSLYPVHSAMPAASTEVTADSGAAHQPARVPPHFN